MGSGSDELDRLRQRPSGTDQPGLLAWRIEPYGGLQPFAQRLRELIGAAVELSETQDFDQETLDDSCIPEWFALASAADRGGRGEILPEVLSGVERYGTARNEDRWELQEWLFCFDPDLRAWRWWDLTTPDGYVAYLWIDTKGEPTVACEELYWAVFSAGAREVSPMPNLSLSDWGDQETVGIP